MAADTDADEPAHDGGEQTDEQLDDERFVVVESTIERGVIVPLCDADVERIEFEIEQKDGERANESVEEWIEHAVRMQFGHIDNEAEYHSVSADVDVPPLVAERARLEYESARQRGKDPELDDILFNNVFVDPNWYVDDEPFPAGEDE